MKAHVYVTLKTSVLDPQGQTIQNALRKIGFAEVTAVRQGKYFELTLAEGLTAGKRLADGIEEEHLVVERISLAATDELIASGDIVDAKTIIGLLLARRFLNAAGPGAKPG